MFSVGPMVDWRRLSLIICYKWNGGFPRAYIKSRNLNQRQIRYRCSVRPETSHFLSCRRYSVIRQDRSKATYPPLSETEEISQYWCTHQSNIQRIVNRRNQSVLVHTSVKRLENCQQKKSVNTGIHISQTSNELSRKKFTCLQKHQIYFC